jgi:hypothetical protein
MTKVAAALEALQLGHLQSIVRLEQPQDAPPPVEAIDQTIAGVWSDLFALMIGTSLERDAEDAAWNIVNVFHRMATKKIGYIDRLCDEIRILQKEQDGSEIATSELEEKIDLARYTETSLSAIEMMRDAAAGHYLRETGKCWLPSAGARSRVMVTAAIVDGNAYLRDLKQRRRDANTPKGTPVVFAGGRLKFGSDDDMRSFADNLTRTLNNVHERVPDMCLVHGGDMQGLDRLAASWAEQKGIQQIRFALDRKLGTKAGFRRNELMLGLRPRYVIAFEGNGVLERLVLEARQRKIAIVDRRGALGTPPGWTGTQARKAA